MRSRGHAALLCLAVFAAHTVLASADTPPVPTDLLRAHPTAWTDPKSRCPDLRQADPEDSPAAVVVFHVGPTGIPSQARIKTSSGSPELDNAALACIMKLRFLPATAAGEGGGIDSWQQMAWRAVMHAAAAPAASAAPAVTPGGASVAAPAAGVAAATLGAAAAGASAATTTTGTAPGGIGSAGAEVRACADAQGKLTQDPVISRSSGDAAFDAAALAIARSGSGHYRPGCMLLSIRPSGP